MPGWATYMKNCENNSCFVLELVRVATPLPFTPKNIRDQNIAVRFFIDSCLTCLSYYLTCGDFNRPPSLLEVYTIAVTSTNTLIELVKIDTSNFEGEDFIFIKSISMCFGMAAHFTCHEFNGDNCYSRSPKS